MDNLARQMRKLAKWSHDEVGGEVKVVINCWGLLSNTALAKIVRREAE